MKMMTFDPQKRITPQQALKHPYFEGVGVPQPSTLHAPVNNNNNANSSQSKNFFNANNDFQKPGSKSRIESRKGVLSRKSSINKNSFYRSKAGVGKFPEYLPNKPTVVGSRGNVLGSGNYLNQRTSGLGSGGTIGSPQLPNLSSSKGIANNSI